jgi:phosphate:Na+ symporter
MLFGFLNFLQFLGSLGLFLYGMKTLSEGIQRAAGESLRNLLRTATQHRLLGVLTGAILTVIIQFSSASTVMFVSFVNADLLSVFQSFSLTIGANIGTTLKGWLFAYIGFQGQIQLAQVAIVLLGIFFPALFSRNKKLKYTAEFFFGMGIILIGLDFLKRSLPDVQEHPELVEWIQSYTKLGSASTLLFVLIGTVITMLLQSSSAMMIIVLVMVSQGWVDFYQAAAMILGENVGTTITANLAALVANINAKRAALFHTLFNIAGVILFLPILYPALQILDWFCMQVLQLPLSAFSTQPKAQEAVIPIALAVFHTMFNTLTALVVLPFLKYYERLLTIVLPSSELEEQHHLQYISRGLLNTTEISLEEARREIARFGNITRRTTKFIQSIVDEKESKNKEFLIERVAKYEEITDRIELEVASYLSRASEQEISMEASQQIRAMLMVIGELETIGDICFHLSKSLERKNEQKIWFNQDQRDHLKELHLQVDKAFDIMIENLEATYDKAQIEHSLMLEANINSLHDKARDKNLKQIEKGKIKLNGALIFNDLVSGYEKIGNHVLRVSQAIVGVQAKRNLLGDF